MNWYEKTLLSIRADLSLSLSLSLSDLLFSLRAVPHQQVRIYSNINVSWLLVINSFITNYTVSNLKWMDDI